MGHSQKRGTLDIDIQGIEVWKNAKTREKIVPIVLIEWNMLIITYLLIFGHLQTYVRMLKEKL